jgi:hypothetical protein
MTRKTRQLAGLARLQELADAPAEQAAYARELLAGERSDQVLQAALQVLAEFPDPATRPLLLERYAAYDEDGVTRDPGGYVRAAILRTLRHVVQPGDIALLERGATTYEFLPPGRSEETWLLRSAALVALDEVDAELASYHAVRLLSDQYTSKMSGEPAVTAVRVLAAHAHFLPLYDYATRYPLAPAEARRPDVLAECLKALVSVPRSVLLELVELFRESQEEIVLVGLFDLIVGHRDGASCADVLGAFLRTTRHYHAYHYLATLIATSRRPNLLALLLSSAADERDPRKVGHLVEALSLVRGDKGVEEVMRKMGRA